jgi:phosphate transport system permease protein
MSEAPAAETSAPRPPRRRASAVAGIIARGEPLVWLMGGAMAICVAMIGALLFFVAWQGLRTFWPVPVVRVETVAGNAVVGEVTRQDRYRPESFFLDALPAGAAEAARAVVRANDGWASRRLVRTGNYELTSEHFTWVSDFEARPGGETRPPWALVLERQSWGRFYGEPVGFLVDGERVADAPADVWRLFREHHAGVRALWAERVRLEREDIGRVNHRIEKERLRLRELELLHGADSAAWRDAKAAFDVLEARGQEEFRVLQERIAGINRDIARYSMALRVADGSESSIALGDIVRAYPANRLTREKLRLYAARWTSFWRTTRGQQRRRGVPRHFRHGHDDAADVVSSSCRSACWRRCTCANTPRPA